MARITLFVCEGVKKNKVCREASEVDQKRVWRRIAPRSVGSGLSSTCGRREMVPGTWAKQGRRKKKKALSQWWWPYTPTCGAEYPATWGEGGGVCVQQGSVPFFLLAFSIPIF